MRKERYTFSLNPVVHDEMVRYLKPRGISLSAYVDSMLAENLKTIKSLKGVKNVGDISLSTIMTLFSGLQDEFKKNLVKEKK